jgi:hypothetical protein
MPRIKASAEQGAVRVEGLNELIARLKALENGSEVAVRLANKEAATSVASHAQGAASGLGGVAAHSAPSVKASAGVKSAGVALGSDAYPMALGAEFGGGRRPTTQQFAPWKGHTGYFLWPTIRRDSDAIDATYRDALDKIIKGVGLE